MTLPALAATALVFALGCGQASPASADSANGVAVPQTTVVVTLLHNKLVHAGPALSSKVVGYVADTRPLTGEQLSCRSSLAAVSADAPGWKCGCRNARTGTPAGSPPAGTRTGSDPWHIVVSREAIRAYIYDHGVLVQLSPSLSASPLPPPPPGTSSSRRSSMRGMGSPPAPMPWPRRAYSNVYQEFEGGPGQIALHGIVGLGRPPGNSGLSWLRPLR